jgi:anti-sigma B factor antagonist
VIADESGSIAEAAGPFSTTIDRCGVIIVTGELDSTTAPMLEENVASVDGPLLLDLRPVSFMDSSGIAALIRIRQRCLEANEGFRLVEASWVVKRVLELTGVVEILTGQNRASPT